MTDEEIMSRIKKSVLEQLDIDESKIVPSASFINDLNADSLDLLELAFLFEKEFKISMQDIDLQKVTSIQALLDYVKSKLNSATA